MLRRSFRWYKTWHCVHCVLVFKKDVCVIGNDFMLSVFLRRTWRRRPHPPRRANWSPRLRTLRRVKRVGLSHFSPSSLPPSLPPSLSLYLPPLTPDNLGLMDTSALLPLLFLTPPLLPHPNLSTPKGEWTSLFFPLSLPPWRLSPPPPPPSTLQFVPFALTLLCHRGRMDITSIHWSPPCFLPVLHTFSLMPREALNPGCNPLRDQGQRCQPSPATARPDRRPWPASVTKRVNTGDLRSGRGWSRTLLWGRFLV